MPSTKRTSSSGASEPKKPRTALSSARPETDSSLVPQFSAVVMNNVVNGPIPGTDMTVDMAGERDPFNVPSSSSPADDLLALSPAAVADAIGASPDEATTEELAVNDEDLAIPSEDFNAKSAYYHALHLPPGSERDPGISLIDLLDAPNDVKNELFTFAEKCMQTNRDEAIVPVDEFLNGNPDSWATHCLNSDYLWNEFVDECQTLGVPIDTVNKMAKFSGPVTANLNITWHYPTHNTRIRDPPRDCKFGFVADHTNPCIKFQFRKIGPNARVCTNDLLPFRADYSKSGVQWQESIPNFASVEEKALDLTMSLHDYSRVHVVVGKEAHDAIKQRLAQDKGKIVQKLFINLQGLAPFGEEPHILVVRHATTNAINSLVFFSYHAQTFFYLTNPLAGLYHDFIWNAACQLANVPVVGEDIFFRMASSKKKGKPSGNLAALINLRHLEKQCNSFLDDKTALQLFASTISKNQEWFDENFPKKGNMSVVELLLRHIVAKSVENQRAAGFPNLAKAREAQRAAGFPSLAKAIENQRAAGFPNLGNANDARLAQMAAEAPHLAGSPYVLKACEAQMAAGSKAPHLAGFLHLAKNCRVQAAPRSPSVTKGLETQKAAASHNPAGSPYVAKARKTQKAVGSPRVTTAQAKKNAVLNLPEVRFFLDHPDTTNFPGITEATLSRTHARLEELRQTPTPPRARSWLTQHAILYSKATPYGIRFDGDGGPPTAAAAAATTPAKHPCFALFSSMGPRDGYFAEHGHYRD